MKWKRVLLCVTVFSLLGGSLLFADSVNQKIRVLINGKEVADGGYLINGTTYVPLREVGGITRWDSNSKRVTVNKPNVHISLFTGNNNVFGNVKVGKLKFNVFSQVDSLTAGVSAVKVTITNPSGQVKDIQSQKVTTQKDNFWFQTDDFTYDFNRAGKYQVGFHIKENANSNYVLVAEKIITALND
ncbi:stalk domain-containing protein [Paenibacillus sp. 7516]|uniref:stalk domain-containing protein n=1 Tax=Paenibacillus sp. 7516 TaxID=2022549 RepID=UPI000BA7B1DB|nr:stalk domain-containing protein [Paenibacillus sp. 7516]PAF33406.1 copper amine oxidase [Paenibacillus sp. 7516]